MTEFVRVRLASGAEVSVSKELALSHGLTPKEKPAETNGRALPAKPQTKTTATRRRGGRTRSTSNQQRSEGPGDPQIPADPDASPGATTTPDEENQP